MAPPRQTTVWKFVNEEKLVNTVCPNANIGTIIAKDQLRSTGQWVLNLYDGENLEEVKGIPPRLWLHRYRILD
jgi:hypothetical protein